MEANARMRVYLAAGLAAVLVALPLGEGQAQSTAIDAIRRETTVKARATGTFDVKVTPLPADQHEATGNFARLSLDKQYRGALEGTSRGQMVAAETAVKGSGAYVAMERVSGTLNGRAGSFILQHNGSMAGGAYDMKVTVVPDSGTDELVGLSGTLKIIIEGGTHSYEFDYTLIDRPGN